MEEFRWKEERRTDGYMSDEIKGVRREKGKKNVRGKLAGCSRQRGLRCVASSYVKAMDSQECSDTSPFFCLFCFTPRERVFSQPLPRVAEG